MNVTTTMAGTQATVSLREGVTLTEQGDSVVLGGGGGWALPLPVPHPRVRAEVLHLAERPRTTADLVGSALDGGADMDASLGMQVLLNKLQSVGALQHGVYAGGRWVASLGGEGTLPCQVRKVPDDAPRQVSRLAVVTVQDGVGILQSGHSHLQVRVDLEFLTPLLRGDVESIPGGHAVADLLFSAGLWVTQDQEERPESRWWAPVDYWFHRRVNDGRGYDAYGGVYAMKDTKPPAFARPPASTRVALPVPDLDAAREVDPSLASVSEDRKSTRAYAPTPISLEDLGALLYRTVRVRRAFVDIEGLDVVDRPIPSGGSLGEIDVYVVADNVEGLSKGVWRYAPDRHELDLVNDDERLVRRMLVEAGMSFGQDVPPPPMTLLLSARFGRVMWKYQGMPYALILKHVGVIYHALYLHATALGLGICGLGGTNTSTFAKATGADPLEEGQVGLLTLGHPREVDPS